MAIATTVHVHTEILAIISALSARMGKKRNEIVIMLLKRIMSGKVAIVTTGNAVRYQGRDLSGSWWILHVRLNDDEYEFFTDMRKLYKMSVSLLLACAARSFSWNGVSDNYHFCIHNVTFAIDGDRVLWNIIWERKPRSP